MTPEKEQRRSAQNAADDSYPRSGYIATRPRERWFGGTLYSSDERPTRSPDQPWPVYDVRDLGLVPHDRRRCARCRAVGK